MVARQQHEFDYENSIIAKYSFLLGRMVIVLNITKFDVLWF